jgi:hypothetical protein
MPEAASSVAAKEAKAKRGKLVYYDPAFCEQARKLCLLGATLKELAAFFGTKIVSIDNWQNRHPEFRAALVAGREMADAEVADKLYHRALGYKHKETKVFCNSDGEVTKVTIDKHYPPDTAAASLWLRSRQPDRWKEKEAANTTAADAVKVLAAIADQLPG